MDVSIIELLKVVIIGVVEGLTEWLPVSSTGHMILVDEFIRLNVDQKFMDMFLVVIQLGAIMAVVVLNFEKLNPFSGWKSRQEKRDTVDLWKKVIVACLPAAVIGLALNDYMEEHLMNAPVVAAMLILYGVLFIVVENYNKRRRPRVQRPLSSVSFRYCHWCPARAVPAPPFWAASSLVRADMWLRSSLSSLPSRSCSGRAC